MAKHFHASQRHILDARLNGFIACLPFFLLTILQNLGEVINLFPKIILKKMLFLKMFWWPFLLKNFLSSVEFWSWAVPASPKGPSVWEQTLLRAFTFLILFENKNAKGGRERESTEIKWKRSWKPIHTLFHVFGLICEKSFPHWWKSYSSKKHIKKLV